jgi:hypothetical protein
MYAYTDEPLFDVPTEPQMVHYEFRGGRWWLCEQIFCDGIHHYWTATSNAS